MMELTGKTVSVNECQNIINKILNKGQGKYSITIENEIIKIKATEDIIRDAFESSSGGPYSSSVVDTIIPVSSSYSLIFLRYNSFKLDVSNNCFSSSLARFSKNVTIILVNSCFNSSSLKYSSMVGYCSVNGEVNSSTNRVSSSE